MHLQEITFARRLTWQELHLPEFIFFQKPIFQNLHLGEFTFGRNYIFPKTYFPEFTLAKICFGLKLHFLKNLFSIIYTCHNLHLAKITFHQKLIFQKLYTSARNFIIDKIYITKIYKYDCSFSKIIKLQLTRRTKKAKEGILSRLVTNFDKQR